MYRELLNSRNVPVTTLTETNREEVLTTEYMKEFYAEGQMFYTYKRRGRNRCVGAITRVGRAITWCLCLVEKQVRKIVIKNGSHEKQFISIYSVAAPVWRV